MKKVLYILTLCLISICAKAQMTEPNELVQVYCEVTCYQYNLFKGDVNALVDFGIAEKAKYANGWIYNTENDKKYSFASPMSVFAYMARKGWEYKDAFVVSDEKLSMNAIKGKTIVWHFILTKKVPIDFTAEDVIGDIDYRNK